MKDSLISAPQSYKPESIPESPFFRGKKEWDGRMGTLVMQAHNWRRAFAASTILSICLVISLAILLNQRRVIPILVGIDKSRGEPLVLGSVENNQLKVGGLEIKFFLSQFIRYVRGVPLDQVVIKQNWIRAYSYLRKEASELLNEITNKDPESPLKQIGKVVVSIQPLSVVQIPDTTSYQARWRETVYSAHGTRLSEYTMLGTFQIEIEPPKDEQMIQENPLGIFIRNFQWNKEL